jgi:hypothetical protein
MQAENNVKCLGSASLRERMTKLVRAQTLNLGDFC